MRPCGCRRRRPTPEAAEALGEAVRDLLDLRGGESVLVVGLGNRAMTPDAVGPLSAGGILVTRAPAAAAAPDFCGSTPGERPGARRFGDYRRGERGNCPKCGGSYAAGPGRGGGRPGRLAARTGLCRVIQVTDAGIVPGSGVGNSRAAFSAETLGVPVVAVGAPTVMDARQPGEQEPLMVTPRDVDARVRRLSSLISAGINAALFPDWSYDEIAQFVDL